MQSQFRCVLVGFIIFSVFDACVFSFALRPEDTLIGCKRNVECYTLIRSFYFDGLRGLTNENVLHDFSGVCVVKSVAFAFEGVVVAFFIGQDFKAIVAHGFFEEPVVDGKEAVGLVVKTHA